MKKTKKNAKKPARSKAKKAHRLPVLEREMADMIGVPASKPDTRIISREHKRPRVEVKLSDAERTFLVDAIEAEALLNPDRRCPLGPWILRAALTCAAAILGRELDKGAAAE